MARTPFSHTWCPLELKVTLTAVGQSGVSASSTWNRSPRCRTHIQVLAKGLDPGGQYVSLYYDNSTCTLPGDLLAAYTANSNGVASATGDADDNLDEIDLGIGPSSFNIGACCLRRGTPISRRPTRNSGSVRNEHFRLQTWCM